MGSLRQKTPEEVTPGAVSAGFVTDTQPLRPTILTSPLEAGGGREVEGEDIGGD